MQEVHQPGRGRRSVAAGHGALQVIPLHPCGAFWSLRAHYRRIHEGQRHLKHVPSGEHHRFDALVGHLKSDRRAAGCACALAHRRLYRHLDGTARQVS